VPDGLAASAGLAVGAGAGGRFLWPKAQRAKIITTIKKDEARRSSMMKHSPLRNWQDVILLDVPEENR
jgi:hypothetical protein